MRNVLCLGNVLLLFAFLISGCTKPFTISVDYAPSDGHVYVTKEIGNVTLPIDSSEKACKVWLQFNSAFSCNIKDGAGALEVKNGKDYWILDNPIICDPKVPYPCGGGCSGLMEKKTGNIKNLSCQTLS